MLRSIDFGESDRVLHLLVPDAGRLTAIAKGARRSVRRFAGTLDLFNHLRVGVERSRGGRMARLDQAVLIRSFPPLRCDSARFALGCYVLELIGRLAPDGGVRADTERLFRFALGALDNIARSRPDLRLRTLLELRALDALGLRPELGRCVRCSRPADGPGALGFHVADGGPVCRRCAARLEGLLPVHAGTLRALERGLRLDLDRLDRLVLPRRSLDEARELLERFQRFHLGVELRSAPFLAQVLGSP